MIVIHHPESWFLYMIRCGNGNVYTGISTDVSRRFKEHSSGGAKAAKSLRGKGPFELVFSQQMSDRSEAQRAEYYVKKLSRVDKQALICEGQLVIDSLLPN